MKSPLRQSGYLRQVLVNEGFVRLLPETKKRKLIAEMNEEYELYIEDLLKTRLNDNRSNAPLID